jgi:hypothetical protein
MGSSSTSSFNANITINDTEDGTNIHIELPLPRQSKGVQMTSSFFCFLGTNQAGDIASLRVEMESESAPRKTNQNESPVRRLVTKTVLLFTDQSFLMGIPNCNGWLRFQSGTLICGKRCGDTEKERFKIFVSPSLPFDVLILESEPANELTGFSRN